MTLLTPEEAQSLLQAARQAAAHAYAPYSRFPVGAALLTETGEVVTGVNVENASYGLTVCAERVAVGTAVSQGHRRFRAVAVWAAARPFGQVTPCGACRQVLVEFLPESAVVIAAATDGGAEPQQTRLAALLPGAFGLDADCGDKDNNTPSG